MRYSKAQCLFWMRERHGTKYDLSEVEFTGMNGEVTIGCPVHGKVQTTPAKFLRSSAGCPKCGVKSKGYAKQWGVHKKFWDWVLDPLDKEYDLMNAKTQRDPVRMKCVHHGWYTTTYAEYSNGVRCTDCSRRVMDSSWKGIEPAEYDDSDKGRKANWYCFKTRRHW